MGAHKSHHHLSHDEAVETSQQLLITAEQLGQMLELIGNLITNIQLQVADLTTDSNTSTEAQSFELQDSKHGDIQPNGQLDKLTQDKHSQQDALEPEVATTLAVKPCNTLH